MNMQFGKKEKALLLGLVGVVIAVLVWFLVASPYKDKTATLRAENEELKPKAELYEAVNARVGEYEDQIVTYQMTRDEILSHFPSNIEREDELMFWANGSVAHPLDLAFADISMEAEPDVVAVVNVTDTGDAEMTTDEDGNVTFQDADIDQITADYTLYGAPLAINFGSTYKGLKDMLTLIESQNDKNQIKELDVSFDESTGLLDGTIAIWLYYIPDTGREYVPTYIPAVPTGVRDVFHTVGTDVNVPVEQVGSEAEAEDDEESED